MAEPITPLSASLARYCDATRTNPRDYPDLHEHVLALAREGVATQNSESSRRCRDFRATAVPS